MKLTKLALSNVRKSYKDYFIYFLTLMFSVCLFYTFNSFQAQEEVMTLTQGQSIVMETTGAVMNMLSVFVGVVLAFLILYANNFLIRRRKKEFGIYMLLGMPKKQISKVLLYETFFVGVLSLVIGLLLGIGCSQLLGVLTATVFSAELDYHVIFSLTALLMTIASFSIIFIVVMLFNTRIIAKVKLIELLHAKKKIEKQRVIKIWISILLLLLSMGCLGVAYHLTSGTLMTFATNILPIMVIGSIGTVLFFVSLSGFLLQFIRRSKKVYFHKLHMFVLRQINAKINTTSLSMSVVCLMLLLSIGALTTGLSLNTILSDSAKQRTPYMYGYEQNEDIDERQMQKLLMLDQAEYWNKVAIYYGEMYIKDLYPYLNEDAKEMLYSGTIIPYIKASDYTKSAEKLGFPKLSITKNQAFIISSSDSLVPYLEELDKKQVSLTVEGKQLTLSPCVKEAVHISIMDSFALALVLPDEVIDGKLTPSNLIWNVNLKGESNLQAYNEQVQENFFQFAATQNMDYMYSGTTKEDIVTSFYGVGMLFTYVGIYLGIVFLMSSAAILALQQLSEAEDSRMNYDVLKKIGTPKNMINKAILSQIAIYFLLPLLLAVVHSFVGVPAVTKGFSAILGIGAMGKDVLITGAFVLVMYGAYFLATYLGYKATLQK